MTIEEYEQYELRREEEGKQKQEKIQREKIEAFHRNFPELKRLNILPDISRKKVLDLLLECGYNNKFSKKKEYYESMKKYYKDELYHMLNKAIKTNDRN